MPQKVTRFGISLETELLRIFDDYLQEKGYTNRSEAIRDIMREKLVIEKISSSNAVCFGIITYVYDHHKRGIEKILNSYQHEFFKSILFTTHVHIDHDNCLEILVIKDKAAKVKKLTDRILSLKGVKHGKFVLTSTSGT